MGSRYTEVSVGRAHSQIRNPDWTSFNSCFLVGVLYCCSTRIRTTITNGVVGNTCVCGIVVISMHEDCVAYAYSCSYDRMRVSNLRGVQKRGLPSKRLNPPTDRDGPGSTHAHKLTTIKDRCPPARVPKRRQLLLLLLL